MIFNKRLLDALNLCNFIIYIEWRTNLKNLRESSQKNQIIEIKYKSKNWHMNSITRARNTSRNTTKIRIKQMQNMPFRSSAKPSLAYKVLLLMTRALPMPNTMLTGEMPSWRLVTTRKLCMTLVLPFDLMIKTRSIMPIGATV